MCIDRFSLALYIPIHKNKKALKTILRRFRQAPGKVIKLYRARLFETTWGFGAGLLKFPFKIFNILRRIDIIPLAVVNHCKDRFWKIQPPKLLQMCPALNSSILFHLIKHL